MRSAIPLPIKYSSNKYEYDFKFGHICTNREILTDTIKIPLNISHFTAQIGTKITPSWSHCDICEDTVADISLIVKSAHKQSNITISLCHNCLDTLDRRKITIMRILLHIKRQYVGDIAAHIYTILCKI